MTLGLFMQASRRIKRGRASAGASTDNANEQQRQDDEEEDEATRDRLYGAHFWLKRLVLVRRSSQPCCMTRRRAVD